MVIDRTTASSSTTPAMCGNMVLTGMPLCPHCLNSNGLAMMLPLSLNCVRSTFIGIGLPSSIASRGFGSKESTCETPPDMKQKITFFALAG